MERRLNAELWDKMHYLFRDYNDRMVHVELDYEGEIDAEALKAVLVCFFEKAPVLHSSFVDNHVRPYWQVNDYTADDILTVKEVQPEELDGEIDKFLTRHIPTDAKVQLNAALLRCGKKSVLLIVENHMCMDGGDLKYFINALCKNYSDYVSGKASPIDLKTGTRSYESVYEDFSPSEKHMAKSLYRNINARDSHAFPLTPDNIRDRSFIARRTLEPELLQRLKKAGKAHGATVNDMLTAAYFHSIYELAGFGENEEISISCAIDLRRHLKDSSDTGVTNHTAWMQCRVPRRGRDVFETLRFTIESVNRFKSDRFIGLHGLPLLSLGYRILPQAASEEIVKIGYSNPLMAMSNIGVLDHKKLALGSLEPVSGFMSGAVKYKPYALLSVTTMRGALTFSMCVRGNEQDEEIVERFFDLLEKYTRALAEG